MMRLFYWSRYLLGRPGWDTGITPPEIVALIEEEKLPAGRAVDLGCGTGTNVIYLARHGWQAVGIDYIAKPIQAARRKARRAGLVDRSRFVVGDVTRLDSLNLEEAPFDLAMDIGCGHSLPPDRRLNYAQSLAQIVKLGGLFMLYMFRPTAGCSMGLEPEEVTALFSPAFRLTWSSLGEDTTANAGSAWYRFERGSVG